MSDTEKCLSPNSSLEIFISHPFKQFYFENKFKGTFQKCLIPIENDFTTKLKLFLRALQALLKNSAKLFSYKHLTIKNKENEKYAVNYPGL